MKKQNEAKIIMAILESYKRVTSYQRGYYDGIRKAGSKDEKITRANIVKHLAILAHFWKNMLEAAENMPHKEKKSFLIRWFFAGTNSQRMVEPLEIANYYGQGKRDYIYQARPKHYILLEKWFNDDFRPPTTAVQISYTNGRNKAVTLTKDSCFWAHVEEAIISCRVLCDGDKSSTDQDKELSRINLIAFEDYVMGLVRTYSVSPEIFLPNTTFMDWWKEYERIVGVSYNSCHTDFMRNSYQGYA